MSKILSVAIPAYNSEKYLEKCLSSFANEEVLDEMEIIVVNDGSKDGTLAIAQSYVERWPQSFVVIDKENGGHGSGINAAAKIACGKYFRVVDADDWVITESLPRYIEALRCSQTDVVITNFHRVDMLSGKQNAVFVPNQLCERELTMEQVMEHYGDVRNCFTIHGVAYKLDIYRECDIILSEKVFYEDTEFITMPFCRVSTVLCLDLFLYQYLIGNVEQSMSAQNQVKRRSHAQLVIERLVAFRTQYTGASEAQLSYFDAKLADMVFYYYMRCLIHDTDRKRGRSDMKKMDAYIDCNAPFLQQQLGGRVKKLMLLHRLHIGSAALDKILESKLYDRFRKILRK